jgi:hydrogenase maturation protease
MNSIAILGIGNNLLQDDGAGIHILNRFAADNPFSNVDCLDAGTIGLAMMDRLTDLQGLVALDAMRLALEPGTVTVLQGPDMDHHLLNHHHSAHEVGLSDLMDALRLSDQLPPNRALIGIEPEKMDWGTEPTEKIAAAIPRAAELARDLVRRWQSDLSAETQL